jgi:hypothetical protein
MAGRVAPYIDNTGLVFAYDQANIVRSYLGEPTTNLVTNGNFSNGKTGWSFTGTANSATSVGTYQGKVALFANGLRYYNETPGYFYQSISVTQGVTYTVSFKYYLLSGTLIFDPDGAYNGGGGLTSTGQWVTYSATFVASSTSLTLNFYGDSGVYAYYYITDIQVEQKSHATPFVNGTRSVTQGLKDLAGRSTIDLSNVSFDSNAQMTFDGSDDHILTSENIALNGSQTFEVITTISGGPQSPAGIISNHDYANTSNFGLNHISGNRIGMSIGYTDNSREYDSKYTTYTATVGTPFHLVMTFDQSSNTVKLYINGVLDSTFVLTKTVKFTSRPVVLGRWDYQYNYYYFNGKIPVAKAYNRALSAADVTQNFNAVRGRYGI